MQQTRKPTQGRLMATALLPILVLVAAGGNWDESVEISDGSVHQGKISAVNGRVRVGHNAEVGRCSTVNGSIVVGDQSRVQEAESVNGRIDIGAGTVVAEEVSTVNGPITMESRSSADEVSSVNGAIRLEGAEVNHDVSTINGDVTMSDGARVGGNIIVQDPGRNSSRRKRPIVIELDGGSVVAGDIIVEDEDIPVKVYIRGGSQVGGKIRGAEVIRD